MRVRSLSVLSLLLGAACAAATGCSVVGDDAASSDSEINESEAITLADVQKILRARGGNANWTAGETSVSKLSRSDWKQLLGIPDSEVHEETVVVKEEAAAPRAREASVGLFDWRNVDGKNFVSPLLDQGRCGSCVAFAAVATLETQLNIAAKDPTSPWQLSPQFLFSCGGGACNYGWFPASAARFLVNKGVTDNACMPYTSGVHADDASCNTACSNAASRTIKARAYTSPTSGSLSIDTVKRALKNGPLMASMTVYDDFMYYTSGVYKHVTGGRAGGHAVSIVGWNDDHQAWIVRNSWGPGWGMEGYFEIAYKDASGVGSDTIALDVPPVGPYVAISDLRDGELLSGQRVLGFAAQSVSGAVSWTLTGTAGSTQGTATGNSATLDTTTVADGIYTIQPHAQNVDGPPHLVYVLNGKETGEIRFKNLANNATVRGTSMFDITVAAKPVPLTQIVWTVTNAAGEEIIRREISNTGPVMELGWNTTKRPNGVYTIKVTGSAGSQSIAPASVTVTVKN